MRKSVEVCVIPAAGRGSRWSPTSNYIPKEMLPLDGIPVIEHVVREAIDSGCTRIVIVISRHKEIIKKYIQENKKLNEKAKFSFIYQQKPEGAGQAILKAKSFVARENFALLWPDMPSFYELPPLKQVIKKFTDSNCDHMIGFSEYPNNNMLYYGEFFTKSIGNNLLDVLHLCPKATKPGESHHKNNRLRTSGRYVLSYKFFLYLKQCIEYSKGKEVGEGEPIQLAIDDKQKVRGTQVSGKIFDIGTPLGYMLTNAKLLTLMEHF